MAILLIQGGTVEKLESPDRWFARYNSCLKVGGWKWGGVRIPMKFILKVQTHVVFFLKKMFLAQVSL